MVFIYPIGIPVGYLMILWRRRRALDPFIDGEKARSSRGDAGRARVRQTCRARMDDQTLRTTSFLWGPYEPEHFLWEVWEAARRLLAAGPFF